MLLHRDIDELQRIADTANMTLLQLIERALDLWNQEWFLKYGEQAQSAQDGGATWENHK